MAGDLSAQVLRTHWDTCLDTRLNAHWADAWVPTCERPQSTPHTPTCLGTCIHTQACGLICGIHEQEDMLSKHCPHLGFSGAQSHLRHLSTLGPFSS